MLQINLLNQERMSVASKNKFVAFQLSSYKFFRFVLFSEMSLAWKICASQEI